MTVVTDLTADAGPALAGEAVVAAEAAATAAGVTIRQLNTMAELHAVCDLYEQIWRFGTKGAPVTSELLRAMSKAGSYVSGAFDGDELIGACVGFFAPPSHEAIHSHIAGVSTRARGRSVGFALKVHQRAWALLHGVTEVSWTFDPLVGRNAYFNLAKLGARPVEYLANFYGPMHDDINGNDDTDRLLVSWRLDDPEVAAACAGRMRSSGRTTGAVFALETGESGGPVPHAREDGRPLLVAVPRDVEAMRAKTPELAARWRTAVRDVLGGLLADGARIHGFDRDDCYVVDPSPEGGIR